MGVEKVKVVEAEQGVQKGAEETEVMVVGVIEEGVTAGVVEKGVGLGRHCQCWFCLFHTRKLQKEADLQD